VFKITRKRLKVSANVSGDTVAYDITSCDDADKITVKGLIVLMRGGGKVSLVALAVRSMEDSAS
jgi:hypothetical protein